jgi:hypothetical protein
MVARPTGVWPRAVANVLHRLPAIGRELTTRRRTIDIGKGLCAFAPNGVARDRSGRQTPETGYSAWRHNRPHFCPRGVFVGGRSRKLHVNAPRGGCGAPQGAGQTRARRPRKPRMPSRDQPRAAAARAALQWPHLETIDPFAQTAHWRGILDGAVHRALGYGGGRCRDAGGLCGRKNVGQRFSAGHPRPLWDCQRCRIPWQRVFMVDGLERREGQSVRGRCASSPIGGKFHHRRPGAACRPVGGKFTNCCALAAGCPGRDQSCDGRRHASDARSVWDPE